jgi:hypothetical protein
MRGSRAVAAVLGATALIVVGGVIAVSAWSHASADPAEDAGSDEIIRTAPETIPDLAAMNAAPAPAAEVASVRTETPPPPVEWAAAGARAADQWTRPKLAQAQTLAARYEPRFDFKLAQRDDTTETQVSVGLGPQAVAAAKPALGVKGRIQRLGFRFQTPPELRRKSRWFVFAASSNQAFGMNLLRSRDGEIRRAGWSAEKIAAVGDGQMGVGWRKGSLQASLGLVEREIAAYGRSAHEKFVAFTLSIRPAGYKNRKGAAEGLRNTVRDPGDDALSVRQTDENPAT